MITTPFHIEDLHIAHLLKKSIKKEKEKNRKKKKKSRLHFPPKHTSQQPLLWLFTTYDDDHNKNKYNNNNTIKNDNNNSRHLPGPCNSPSHSHTRARHGSWRAPCSRRWHCWLLAGCGPPIVQSSPVGQGLTFSPEAGKRRKKRFSHIARQNTPIYWKCWYRFIS